MGGAACAKEILCNPPAMARAKNKARLAQCEACCVADLKEAKLVGLRDLREKIEFGQVVLTEKQMQCFHRLSAVLDCDDETFDDAYSALRESLIVTG